MKKCIPIWLLFVICFAFCACSGAVSDAGNAKPVQTSAESEKEEISETYDTIKESDTLIYVRVGREIFTARLYDNETAKAFSDMLPLTLDMNELNDNEKYYNLPNSLPTNIANLDKINNGDIMLYGNDCLVLFYDSFSTSYRYTKIGYIENPIGLADAVGSSNIIITFEKITEE